MGVGQEIVRTLVGGWVVMASLALQAFNNTLVNNAMTSRAASELAF